MKGELGKSDETGAFVIGAMHCLETIAAWTPDRLLEEARRFADAYVPISILPPDRYLSVVLALVAFVGEFKGAGPQIGLIVMVGLGGRERWLAHREKTIGVLERMELERKDVVFLVARTVFAKTRAK